MGWGVCELLKFSCIGLRSPYAQSLSCGGLRIRSTWAIRGRLLGSFFMHWIAACIIQRDSYSLYCPFSLGSRSSLSYNASRGRAHSTRETSCLGRLCSMGLRPVRSSSSTMPKAYTSALTVICPVSAYSGAKYPMVPNTRVSSAKSPSVCRLASPKSPTIGVKSCVSKILLGRKSR